MDDFSKSGMVSLAEMMTNKGWINSNTGGGYKAALNKVLGDLPDDTDVRTINVKTQVLRYNNLHPGELSPASLKQYEKRVQSMIGYYISWKEDPTNFKPPQRVPSSEKNEKASKSIKPTANQGVTKLKPVSTAFEIVTGLDGAERSENEHQRLNGASTGLGGGAPVVSLTMPFPLRDNYLAQIMIPRDMNKDEADRLCTFIQALARA